MRAKYVLNEVALGLWRNVTMTIAMIITMAVSLTMLGASVLLFWQVNNMREFFYDKIEVSIFLKSDVTEAQRTALDTALKEDPLVQEYDHESKEEAYEKFQTMFRDAPDLVNSVKPESLPEAFRVKLKNPEQYKDAYDKYIAYAGISEIVDQQRLLGKIFGILGALQKMALVIAIVQGAAALLLVANTIQVAAYSKRREVAVMKLVGAGNWFIQAPFVLEAVFAGLIGSIFSYAALVLAKIFLIDGSLKPLTELLTPVPWRNIHIMLPLLALAGGAVNAVTGWVTLRFYIRV
ncbi:MAG TPA: permease-like cell division protein FtsX [Micromonosporaceae bacterium]|nr:permease-like cell division protein FtsX [Micromonosporaceae bacterium]